MFSEALAFMGKQFYQTVIFKLLNEYFKLLSGGTLNWPQTFKW